MVVMSHPTPQSGPRSRFLCKAAPSPAPPHARSPLRCLALPGVFAPLRQPQNAPRPPGPHPPHTAAPRRSAREPAQACHSCCPLLACCTQMPACTASVCPLHHVRLCSRLTVAGARSLFTASRFHGVTVEGSGGGAATLRRLRETDAPKLTAEGEATMPLSCTQIM